MTTDKQQPQVPANFKFSDSYWQAFVASCQPPEPPSPQAAQARADAVAIVDDIASRRHMAPEEREAAIDVFAQAALDDARDGGDITFLDGTRSSRVEQYKRVLAGPTPAQARQEPDRYTNEQLLAMTPGGRQTLELKRRREAAFARAGMDPERRRLLEMTPLGRLALRRIEEENGG